MDESLSKKLTEKLKGKTWVVLVIGALAILLIVFSGNFTGSSTNKKEANVASEFYVDDYVDNLEAKLQGVISSITGEKSPRVMVTLNSSVQNVYATENITSNKEGESSTQLDSEEKYVIVKSSDGSQTAVPVTQIQPEIKGVVVVSMYASNPVVKEQILEAVKTSMGLPATKVCVVNQNSRINSDKGE